jgi:hypothetical protein
MPNRMTVQLIRSDVVDREAAAEVRERRRRRRLVELRGQGKLKDKAEIAEAEAILAGWFAEAEARRAGKPS